MTEMPKVLVVDSGRRAPDSILASELAEMGFASVTTPFEAADDVLAMMQTPAAIILQMPPHHDPAVHSRFLALAARLRSAMGPNGTPVIVTGGTSGAATMVQNHLGARATTHEPSL